MIGVCTYDYMEYVKYRIGGERTVYILRSFLLRLANTWLERLVYS
jgi:hypothetical protein